jgi:hypothetical protein
MNSTRDELNNSKCQRTSAKKQVSRAQKKRTKNKEYQPIKDIVYHREPWKVITATQSQHERLAHPSQGGQD